jgi:hypothetical protein
VDEAILWACAHFTFLSQFARISKCVLKHRTTPWRSFLARYVANGIFFSTRDFCSGNIPREQMLSPNFDPPYEAIQF